MILIVDDDENVRAVAKKTLEQFGYRVLLAANGAEAISAYAQRRDEIAVVFTDMAMPVMDGAAAIVALKAMNPQVKIIASSGLTAEGDVTDAAGAYIRYFIQKPYTAESMMKIIAKALHEQA